MRNAFDPDAAYVSNLQVVKKIKTEP